MMSSSPTVAMIRVTQVYPVMKIVTSSLVALVHLVSQGTEKTVKVTLTLCCEIVSHVYISTTI